MRNPSQIIDALESTDVKHEEFKKLDFRKKVTTNLIPYLWFNTHLLFLQHEYISSRS